MTMFLPKNENNDQKYCLIYAVNHQQTIILQSPWLCSSVPKGTDTGLRAKGSLIKYWFEFDFLLFTVFCKMILKYKQFKSAFSTHSLHWDFFPTTALFAIDRSQEVYTKDFLLTINCFKLSGVVGHTDVRLVRSVLECH